MADDEVSPLLAGAAKGKSPARSQDADNESTPLLASSSETIRYDGEHANGDAHQGDDAQKQTKKPSLRWPSIIAMVVLGLVAIAIIILAFIVPDAVQQYAQQAAVIEPTNLSLESIKSDGIQARIQANFRLDASRVSNDDVRRIGKATTWMARKLGTDEVRVEVYLPDYDNILLGSAVVPAQVIDLRDGYTTSFDFVTEITTGDLDGVRTLANQFLTGQLGTLRLNGKADLKLSSGIIPLGTHTVSETLSFEADKLPGGGGDDNDGDGSGGNLPKYNVTHLSIKDVPGPGNTKSILADLSLTAFNPLPVRVDIPEMAFEVLVLGCNNLEAYITVAEVVTGQVEVRPRAEVAADIHGLVQEIPEALTRPCPHSSSSPLDLLISEYMRGNPATVYVRGSSKPDGSTPRWIADVLASMFIPVPLPARTLGGLIRNFSLTEVNFKLPDPSAHEGDPEANPRVSGTIHVIAAVPPDMKFGINVTEIKASADVFYKGNKLGVLSIPDWRKANSTQIDGDKGKEGALAIEARVDEAPLNVTDPDVFTDVIQTIIFTKETVTLHIQAGVDVRVDTALGMMTLKDLPAEGNVPIKPLPKDSLGSLTPKVKDIEVVGTTSDSITIRAVVNITNPTPYTAHIPYANVHVLSNGSIIGDATVTNIDVVSGPNINIPVTATWQPSRSGPEGRQTGRDLISQYLSGFNTTIMVKAHSESIPGQPIICDGLSRFNMTFATPKMHLPDDKPGETTHFIRDATFHFLSSTATFTLVSPLQFNTVFLDYINATALYNHTDPIGTILYSLPFAAPPGKSTTPKLPVSWDLGSVGYEAVKKAIGGTLKLDAEAEVHVRIGNWMEQVWYKGTGIGAGVHIS